MARRSPEPAASPVRGAVLVVVAIVVGFFLLRNGIDTSNTIVAGDDPTPTTEAPTDGGGDTDGATTDGETDGSTTPTTEAVRPPDKVRVIVLNGSSVDDGAATTWSNGIQAFGYSMLTPTNANVGVETTQVLHQAGFQQEAAELIASLGSPAGVVPQKLGNQPPGEIGDADLVVVLGPDLASTTPPSPGGGGGNTTGAG